MSSGGAELIADLYVALPADVILFYPDDPSIFLVGTYLLDEVTRKRRGKIFVFQILSNDGSVDTTENHKELDQVECDAVLDMKWHEDALYVAHSTGSISIYIYDVTNRHLRAITQHKLIIDPDVLILSLSVSSAGILTSHSDGTVGLWTLELRCMQTFTVSDLEVWIQAWGHNSTTIYTGSDDGVLAAWDTRTEARQADGPMPCIFRNRRTHGAGVTAVVPIDEYQLLTGSYDDNIRLLDIRNPNRAIRERNIGGGVWRVIPKTKTELLACCMYNGAKILATESFNVIKEWNGHESIVYGGDVTEGALATCSFYDKRVCIWR